jgi:GH25 family lysozyme M1 (1,4-beta-N-acetylmuramidase)
LGTAVTELDALPERMAAMETRLDAIVAMVESLRTGPASGVDVSGHQTLEQVRTLAADADVAFVIVKATEGETWTSPDYATQRTASGAKFLGAYHFAWPNQDPAKEATHFLATAALKPGQLALLDMERAEAGESWATRVAYALAWLDAVKAATGAAPLLYLNWSWIKAMRTAATADQWKRLTAYPLWLADWSGVPGKHSTVTSKDGTNPDSWPILLHQYAVLDGIDRNWTPDLAALRATAVKVA